MKNLYESLFSTASATKDDLYRLALKDAIYKFFHIENPDKVPVTITKSGSYYDVVVDMAASEQYRITVDIKRSDKSGIDFKHTRAKLNTDDDCSVLLISNGVEINTNNFFTYFEADGYLGIQGSSLSKDITIKSTGDAIFYESMGRDIYIKGKIICDLLIAHDQDGKVIDLRNMNRSSSINELYIKVSELNDLGQSLINHIITCDPDKGYDTLVDMRDDYAEPQVNPEIFDTLKLPDISLIKNKQYTIMLSMSPDSYDAFSICKKGIQPTQPLARKIKQDNPAINAKWVVYFWYI